MPIKDIKLELVEEYLSKENISKLLTLGIYDVLTSNDERLRYHIEVNRIEFQKSLQLDFELMLQYCETNARDEEHIAKRQHLGSSYNAYCIFYQFISNYVSKREKQEVSENLRKMFDYFKPESCK
ncbi:MAG: Unknown protein [uncultured Sulfurovum sp.]|uniref:Uncharacterized protein n=1 Tax=uncultured Sulfurovum sp. TaxID=269237 RepID=A0A6S6SBF4_9BACT|nr:MAG: Unknown protein [uncultured Sulfurovum sp.]